MKSQLLNCVRQDIKLTPQYGLSVVVLCLRCIFSEQLAQIKKYRFSSLLCRNMKTSHINIDAFEIPSKRLVVQIVYTCTNVYVIANKCQT